MNVRQAIVTKFLGPTNNRGSRVKASAFAGSIIVSWDYSKGVDDNHYAAALALALKLEWVTEYDLQKGNQHLIGGSLPGGHGNAYIIAEGI